MPRESQNNLILDNESLNIRGLNKYRHHFYGKQIKFYYPHDNINKLTTDELQALAAMYDTDTVSDYDYPHKIRIRKKIAAFLKLNSYQPVKYDFFAPDSPSPEPNLEDGKKKYTLDDLFRNMGQFHFWRLATLQYWAVLDYLLKSNQFGGADADNPVATSYDNSEFQFYAGEAAAALYVLRFFLVCYAIQQNAHRNNKSFFDEAWNGRYAETFRNDSAWAILNIAQNFIAFWLADNAVAMLVNSFATAGGYLIDVKNSDDISHTAMHKVKAPFQNEIAQLNVAITTLVNKTTTRPFQAEEITLQNMDDYCDVAYVYAPQRLKERIYEYRILRQLLERREYAQARLIQLQSEYNRFFRVLLCIAKFIIAAAVLTTYLHPGAQLVHDTILLAGLILQVMPRIGGAKIRIKGIFVDSRTAQLQNQILEDKKALAELMAGKLIPSTDPTREALDEEKITALHRSILQNSLALKQLQAFSTYIFIQHMQFKLGMSLVTTFLFKAAVALSLAGITVGTAGFDLVIIGAALLVCATVIWLMKKNCELPTIVAAQPRTTSSSRNDVEDNRVIDTTPEPRGPYYPITPSKPTRSSFEKTNSSQLSLADAGRRPPRSASESTISSDSDDPQPSLDLGASDSQLATADSEQPHTRSSSSPSIISDASNDPQSSPDLGASDSQLATADTGRRSLPPLDIPKSRSRFYSFPLDHQQQPLTRPRSQSSCTMGTRDCFFREPQTPLISPLTPLPSSSKFSDSSTLRR